MFHKKPKQAKTIRDVAPPQAQPTSTVEQAREEVSHAISATEAQDSVEPGQLDVESDTVAANGAGVSTDASTTPTAANKKVTPSNTATIVPIVIAIVFGIAIVGFSYLAYQEDQRSTEQDATGSTNATTGQQEEKAPLQLSQDDINATIAEIEQAFKEVKDNGAEKLGTENDPLGQEALGF